uniref:AzmA n=1 Tax=Streptomyces sp. FXJ1.264 TaxID=634337 RepID=A0A142D835_9ACTN|nr:AzmA [Streptomyces sp. FXJ1.264]
MTGFARPHFHGTGPNTPLSGPSSGRDRIRIRSTGDSPVIDNDLFEEMAIQEPEAVVVSTCTIKMDEDIEETQ